MMPLHVKLMTGDYVTVEIPIHSHNPTYDIKRAIQRANPDLPTYYQTLVHVDPATGEPYGVPTAYREDSILLLFMSPADVYLKQQEILRHYVPDREDKIESRRYSIHIYHEKQQYDTFSFLVNEFGIYMFTRKEVQDSWTPWIHHVNRKALLYHSTMEEAVLSLPACIRDAIIQKWNAKEIISYGDSLPYHTLDMLWEDSEVDY